MAPRKRIMDPVDPIQPHIDAAAAAISAETPVEFPDKPDVDVEPEAATVEPDVDPAPETAAVDQGMGVGDTEFVSPPADEPEEAPATNEALRDAIRVFQHAAGHLAQVSAALGEAIEVFAPHVEMLSTYKHPSPPPGDG